MIAVVANSLVLIGCIIQLASLLVVRKITRQLPAGRSCRSWCAMSALIVLFLLGYLGYVAVFWGRHNTTIDLIVPGIFFFGACFVWFSTYIALQTTIDVKRIGELEHETLTDPLTGVYNRRFLQQRLAEEIAKARRHCLPLSVLLFDLDHFKRINDRNGHQAGDRILVEISVLVKTLLRESDVLSRYGGEEFLVIAPNTGQAAAATLAERLRARVEAHVFLEFQRDLTDHGIGITISIGLASFDDDEIDQESLIGKADRALYQAKRDGRNRVVESNPAEITALASRAG